MKQRFIEIHLAAIFLIDIKTCQIWLPRPIEIKPLDDYITEATFFIAAINQTKPV